LEKRGHFYFGLTAQDWNCYLKLKSELYSVEK
jgi:hypothetical protein